MGLKHCFYLNALPRVSICCTHYGRCRRGASYKETRSETLNVLVLHGVNLNMFGKRDSAVYGTATLADIDSQVQTLAKELGVNVECFQANHEGEMCEKIHQAHSDAVAAVVINA